MHIHLCKRKSCFSDRLGPDLFLLVSVLDLMWTLPFSSPLIQVLSVLPGCRTTRSPKLICINPKQRWDLWFCLLLELMTSSPSWFFNFQAVLSIAWDAGVAFWGGFLGAALVSWIFKCSALPAPVALALIRFNSWEGSPGPFLADGRKCGLFLEVKTQTPNRCLWNALSEESVQG